MRRLRATHTYVIMAVSEPAYGEIREKLLQAGYDHVIDGGGSEETIDMHGIALQIEVNEKQGAKPPMQSTPAEDQASDTHCRRRTVGKRNASARRQGPPLPSSSMALGPRRTPSDGSDGADPSGDPVTPNALRICDAARNR